MWPEFYHAVATAPRARRHPCRSVPLRARGNAGLDPTRDEAWVESVLAEALEAGLVSDAVLASTGLGMRPCGLSDRVDVLAAGKPTQVFDAPSHWRHGRVR